MLRDIQIQNFRCFQDTKLSGFAKLNLITGKNNSGKTALLEALYLAISPRPSTVSSLQRFRHESIRFGKLLPKRTWDNFFYIKNKSNSIILQFTNDLEDIVKYGKLSISCYDLSDEVPQEVEANANLEEYINIDTFAETSPEISLLKLEMIINGNDASEARLFSTGNGIIKKSAIFSGSLKVSFIPAASLTPNQKLASEYEKAQLDRKEDRVLTGFKLIDPLIEKVETFNIDGSMLYLTRKSEERLPISLFGDAVNRIANLILCIINNIGGILLIDEIENGIHYSSQSELWRMLFRLAKRFDVQIFATTHSLEMLQAFAEVGTESEEFKQMGAHFEMARNPRSNQIVGIRRDLDILEYSLDHGKGVRGE